MIGPFLKRGNGKRESELLGKKKSSRFGSSRWNDLLRLEVVTWKEDRNMPDVGALSSVTKSSTSRSKRFQQTNKINKRKARQP